MLNVELLPRLLQVQLLVENFCADRRVGKVVTRQWHSFLGPLFQNLGRNGYRLTEREEALIIVIKSAIVMLLWNALIPNLFHGPPLTYAQALGLTVLVKLLFGFPRFGPFSGRHLGPPWKARWAGLPPEEREKLREEIRRRCWGEAST